ncbi:type I-E CRISPR-associated protein Cse1/CasA [Streptomyces shenzhenensis]|uniref:Type I-E CRISPR-associated protein Cse1/CasA n=1 Tax=Streptomyces shenzhenensis TaxID=943815 RepID=A0A3M0HWW4_9ACTN|nr:type I-E CRISPR-associated protein Cse1/CasA [Streptomyces shenzhenensis]RMB80550.1 type I-E CRISPR-associated protein Cse1/CasA [Streptomyces shenzhenensis]
MAETTAEPPAVSSSFDLTARPWIGVLDVNGRQHEVSLRQVFAQAGSLRRVVGDLPTQEFALLRLLLAIAHDALDGPQDIDEWAELRDDLDCFAPVQAYLDAHRERFDLLHPEAPFFQTAGLHTAKNEIFPLNRIVADVPNGEPFFTARRPDGLRLTFAEAARWVVHAHAYDTSGIKSGAVGDDRVKGGKVYPLGTGWVGGLGGVFAEGDTLRDTLLLNLVGADTDGLDIDAGDRPAWRREPPGPGGAERAPTGPRDLYTWQSRRLRLHHDHDGVHGVVIGYGDPLASRNKFRREPMTSWRRSRTQEKKLGEAPVYLPREHDPARAAWRGIASLVADRTDQGQTSQPAANLRPGVLEWIARLVTDGHLERGHLVRTRVVGAAYGTQQSVIDDIVDDHLLIPVVLLHRQDRIYGRQAVNAADDADLAVRALGDLAADLAAAAGSTPDGPRDGARRIGFDQLEQPYRVWLAELASADDPFELRSQWQGEVRRLLGRLGDRLIEAAGDAAWQGRTVTGKNGTVWLNAGLADTWFRARLAKALPGPAGGGADTDAGGGTPGTGMAASPRPTSNPDDRTDPETDR